jgi:DNA-binding beta-propeller fold protein YncE
MPRIPTILALSAAFVALALPGSAPAEMIVGDAIADMLLVADTQTGLLTEQAPVGTPHIVSLAYDDASGVAYCSDTSEGVNQILEIDIQTGATTMVYQVPDFWTVLHCLAVDPATGDLYAIDQHTTALYRVDLVGQQLVLIGETGVNWVTGADFDPTTGQLYACIGGLDDSGALYRIDHATGVATLVASTHRLMGLAFSCDGSELYGVTNSWYPANPGLYRIDRATGDWETIGEYPGRNLMSIECVNLNPVSIEETSWGKMKAIYR